MNMIDENKIVTLGTLSTYDNLIKLSVAILDSSGKVSSTLLPSYVDDVIEIASITNIGASFGDILWSDKTITSSVRPASDGVTPIGLCVAATGFFGENEPARFMSLKYMNYTTPETGSLTAQGMYWGNEDKDISTIDNIQTTHNGGLPNGFLTTSWQTQTSYLIPSVFDANNEWNTSVLGAANQYAVTDIDGKNKTDKILATAKAQSDWLTATSITNDSVRGYAPPVCCCARYHTVGTEAGDWYLGAAGEMSMIIALRDDINTKLAQIATVYANDSVSSLANNKYWSSTEYNSNNAYNVNNNNGNVSYISKLNSYNVVAMLAVPSRTAYYNDSNEEITLESGKIYVNKTNNKTYRWSGSALVEISESLALGETNSTAYRGDRGKIAYDHSLLTSGNPHNVTKANIGLSNVTNDAQVKRTEMGTASGVATLDSNSKVPLTQLRGELIHHLTNVSGITTVTTNPYYAARWSGTLDGITELYTGLIINIKVPVNYTGDWKFGIVLNVNSLGEHPVIRNVSNQIGSAYPAGCMLTLIYDAAGSANVYRNSASSAAVSGVWKIADYDSTNTFQLRHNAGNYIAATAVGRYKLLLQKNETTLLPVNSVDNSTATTKTLTTEAFNPFGQILFYSNATQIAANAEIPAANLFNQVDFNLAYSFNTGSTLTAKKDVYIVAVPQSDGTAKLDSTPITQTLPTGDNGKIYIYLGHASSTTNVEVHVNHPIYWYKNGKIVPFTGSAFALEDEISPIQEAIGLTEKYYEYVDLGLPSGTKWAKCNVGAEAETDNGLYFAWGETKGYPDASSGKAFSWNDYKYGNSGSASAMTKYNATDGLTTLLPEDDAAHANMEGNWRMPTEEEQLELYDNTDHEWTTLNGVYGRKFMKRSDHDVYIFIPAAGYCNNGNRYDVGSVAYVWSSSLKQSGRFNARVLYVDEGVASSGRYVGFSVRGVLSEDKPNEPKYESTKADKVEGAVEGNFPTLSEDGNLKDSGMGVDNAPTANSNNLVKSGGVAEEIALSGVYDVSAKNPTAGPNSDGKFTDLAYVLTHALIPTAVMKGGMSIKFVQSSDNKYVQFRLMKNQWSTTVTDWQGAIGLTEKYYADLVDMRDLGKLIPGQYYRITDYVTTVNELTAPNARSAGHPFDIIVMADSESTLNETAYAVVHSGDSYFQGARLDAWELKYRLDNVQWSKQAGTYVTDEDAGYLFLVIGDITLSGHTYKLLQGFGMYIGDWSDYALMETVAEGEQIICYYGYPEDFDPDEPEVVGIASGVDVLTEVGKGTIIYMKDEYGNEAGYDFKNIQQKRWKVTDELDRSSLNGKYLGVLDNLPAKLSIEDENDFIWAYLYSVYNYAGGTQDTTDHSLTGKVHEMVTNFTVDSNNAFVWNGDYNEAYKCTFSGYVNGSSFSGYVYRNTFSGNVRSNTFSGEVYNNSFSGNMQYNTFSVYVRHNTFSGNVNNNSFSENVESNLFSGYVNKNSFSGSVNNNSFSGSINDNSFSESVNNNPFSGNVNNNSFSGYVESNLFSGYVYQNTFSRYVNGSSFSGNVKYNTFSGNLQNSIISGQLSSLQINASNGASGTINCLYTLGKIDGKTITVPTNAAYPTYAAMTTAGQLKTWNPAD